METLGSGIGAVMAAVRVDLLMAKLEAMDEDGREVELE